MNRKLFQRQAVEIDLKEVLWKLLEQWKAVLLVSLIMALLVCGVRHMKDVSSYNAQIAAQKKAAEEASLSIEERIANVMAAVPSDEQREVYYLSREQEWLDEQKEYLHESILMQTDPTNQRVLKMIYDIDPDDENDRAVLVEAYQSFLRSEEVIAAVKPLISKASEDRYISELFYEEEEELGSSATAERSNTFKVDLILLEDTDADAVKDAVASAIKKHSSEIEKKNPHSISLIEDEVVHVYHEDNVRNRMDMFTNVDEREVSLRNMQSYLSAAQKAAISSITAIRRETAVAEKMTNADDTATGPAYPGWNKKFAVFGFILGALLYACVYALSLIIKGNINSSVGAEKYSGTRLLGEVYYDSESKGVAKLFHSCFIERQHYGGKDDADIQISKTVEALASICKHIGTDNVTMIDMIQNQNDGRTRGLVNTIVTEAAKKGLKTSVVDASEECDEKNLLNVDKAVVTVDPGTKASSLAKITGLCSLYDIEMLGNIYIAEK